jgi:hypothetical protein
MLGAGCPAGQDSRACETSRHDRFAWIRQRRGQHQQGLRRPRTLRAKPAPGIRTPRTWLRGPGRPSVPGRNLVTMVTKAMAPVGVAGMVVPVSTGRLAQKRRQRPGPKLADRLRHPPHSPPPPQRDQDQDVQGDGPGDGYRVRAGEQASQARTRPVHEARAAPGPGPAGGPGGRPRSRRPPTRRRRPRARLAAQRPARDRDNWHGTFDVLTLKEFAGHAEEPAQVRGQDEKDSAAEEFRRNAIGTIARKPGQISQATTPGRLRSRIFLAFRERSRARSAARRWLRNSSRMRPRHPRQMRTRLRHRESEEPAPQVTVRVGSAVAHRLEVLYDQPHLVGREAGLRPPCRTMAGLSPRGPTSPGPGSRGLTGEAAPFRRGRAPRASPPGRCAAR